MKQLAGDPSKVIVEQPVEKGIPEAVREREPGGDEVEEGRWLAARARGHDLLDRPGRHHDDEAQAHSGHCARGRGRQSALVHHQLKFTRSYYVIELS